MTTEAGKPSCDIMDSACSFVKITSQAEAQMQEIIHYITYGLKAPDAALHLLNVLDPLVFIRRAKYYSISICDN